LNSEKGEQSAGRFARVIRHAGERCASATAALSIATARGCQIAYFKGLARFFYAWIKPPKWRVTTITAAPQE
jgi:hypothetical protein